MKISGLPTALGVPTFNVRARSLIVFVAVTVLMAFYLYYNILSFSKSFLDLSQVEELAPYQSSSNINAENISQSNVSDISSVAPDPSSQRTTMTSPTAIAQVKTGPLYMTATFYGGQGNQLFVYASLLGIAKAHNRTAFIRRGTILERVFEITHVNNDINTDGFIKVREKMYAAFETRLMNLSKENITLVAGMQAWRYFTNIEDEVRRELTFLPHLRKQINDTLEKIRNQFKGHIIVGVHVRRGDFLSSANIKKGYGVANASYFVKAFARMRSMLNSTNVTYIVASDDLAWCHEHLNSSDVHVLEPGSSMLHFGVLANCDHVIMSGGTYGWWVAWLANGRTIYYEKYLVKGTWLFRGVHLPDYYPADWVPLGD